MITILLSWLIMAGAFWLTARVLPGFEVRDYRAALIVAAIFGVINWLIGWLLFVLIGIASLGIGFLLSFLTRWLVNALLLKLTDSLSSHLRIDGFRTALIAALMISLLATVGQWLLRVVLI